MHGSGIPCNRQTLVPLDNGYPMVFANKQASCRLMFVQKKRAQLSKSLGEHKKRLTTSLELCDGKSEQSASTWEAPRRHFPADQSRSSESSSFSHALTFLCCISSRNPSRRLISLEIGSGHLHISNENCLFALYHRHTCFQPEFSFFTINQHKLTSLRRLKLIPLPPGSRKAALSLSPFSALGVSDHFADCEISLPVHTHNTQA